MNETNRVELDGVTVRYTDEGAGPTVVFVHGVYVSGEVLRLLATGPGRRYFLKSVCATRPDEATTRSLFGRFLDSRAARSDAVRTSGTLESSITLEAVPALKAFEKPVLLAWGDRDAKLFPLDHAERLAGDFPNARLEIVAGASTFVMVDRPAELAALIENFVNPPD